MGTAHAYFKVRATFTMLLGTHILVKLMVIIYQNDEKGISYQNLAIFSLVFHFLLPFSSPISAVSGNRPHFVHAFTSNRYCVQCRQSGGTGRQKELEESLGNQLFDKED